MSDEIAENSIKVVEEVRKFAQSASEKSKTMLNRVRSDLYFAGGSQLDESDKSMRGPGRAEMVFPISRNLCNSQINRFLTSPFGIVCAPRSSKYVREATLAQGLIRGIEQDSDAVSAYGVAVDRQVKGGIGYCVVTTDYADDSSFDQVVKIQSIENPCNVIFDPFSTKLNGSDANKVAVVEYISKHSAKEKYGEECVDQYSRDTLLDATVWNEPSDCVAVVTYYERKRTNSKIYLDETGAVKNEGEVRKNSKLKSRATFKTTVCVHKIVGKKLISTTELPMAYIPVVPFYGERIDTKNGFEYVGFIYWGKASFKMVNYLANATIEQIAKSPKSSKFVEMKSIAPYMDIWNVSHNISVPFLPWDSKDADGNAYAPPINYDPVVNISDKATALAGFQGLASDILGIPKEGIAGGVSSNETAEAVLTRTKSVETNNYQYMLNAKESVKQIGRCIFEAMVIAYDTEREMTIVTKDGADRITVNLSEMGLSLSNIDIDVDAGPMIASQRKENVNAMIALGTMLGSETAIAFAPYIAKNSEFEDSEAITAVLQQVADQKLGLTKGGGEDPIAMQAMQSAEQAIEGFKAQLDQANLYIQQQDSKIFALEEDSQVQLVMKRMDSETKIYIERIKQAGSDQRLQAEIEADRQKSMAQYAVDMRKIQATQPRIEVIEGARPDYSSVGGMRNAL